LHPDEVPAGRFAPIASGAQPLCQAWPWCHAWSGRNTNHRPSTTPRHPQSPTADDPRWCHRGSTRRRRAHPCGSSPCHQQDQDQLRLQSCRPSPEIRMDLHALIQAPPGLPSVLDGMNGPACGRGQDSQPRCPSAQHPCCLHLGAPEPGHSCQGRTTTCLQPCPLLSGRPHSGCRCARGAARAHTLTGCH